MSISRRPKVVEIWLILPTLGTDFFSGYGTILNSGLKLTSCRRAAATVCPRPSPPTVGAEAPPSRRQRSSSFPRPARSHAHRCSRLTRQHGGKQSGLVTLKVVSESRVTWATSVPILVIISLSVLDLGPMYATDRQTSDTHHRLMPPRRGRHNNNNRLTVNSNTNPVSSVQSS